MRYPSIKGELVKFQAKDGLALDGFLHRSSSGNKKAIINVFGMTGNFFSSKRYDELCRAAKGSGFDVFMPNNRGMGMVNGFHHKRGGKTVVVGTARERFEDCVYDIDGAVRFLRGLGYRTIVLQGHSTGCQKIVYYLFRKPSAPVDGLVLLAPDDDHNVARKELGKRFGEAVRIAKKMVRSHRGDEITPAWISYYSAKRFLSYAGKKSVEGRLFNYNSKLKEVSSIHLPMLVVFGARDEFAVLPVKQYVGILKSKTSSASFESVIIGAADHGFYRKEKELACAVMGWVTKLKDQ